MKLHRLAMLTVFVSLIISISPLTFSQTSSNALEPLILYDDFNGNLINPDKWFGSESGRVGTEARRGTFRNHLQMIYHAFGNTISNSGRSEFVYALSFANSASVTAIEATIQVKEFVSTGCAGNPAPTFAQARLAGFFFNSGVPTPGSLVNDVFASIGVQRRSDSNDPPNILRVVTRVFHSTLPNGAGIEIDSKDLGPIKAGEKVRLRVQWDADNDRFIFQRDDEPEVFSSYTLPDAAPAGVPTKQLDFRHSVANCTTDSRPEVFTEVFFDDVFVNQAAFALQSRGIELKQSERR